MGSPLERSLAHRPNSQQPNCQRSGHTFGPSYCIQLDTKVKPVAEFVPSHTTKAGDLLSQEIH